MNTPSINLPTDHRRGFTLVELLVVIAILAILAALIFSVASTATRKARSMSCIQNLKGWSLVFAACAADRNGRFPTPNNWAAISHTPYGADTSDGSSWGRSPFADYWHEDFYKSMRMQLDNRGCPCLAETFNAGSGNPSPTYMMNRNLSNRESGNLEVVLNNLERPGNQIIFIDGGLSSPLNLSKKSDITDHVLPAAEAHGGTVNAVFADLHVEPLKPEHLLENWSKMLTNSTR